MTVQPWHAGRQRVRNAHPIPRTHRRLPHPLPVTVQLVWERDGVEWVEAEAHGWAGRLVHVIVDDPRLLAIGLWGSVSDVRRQSEAGDSMRS